MPLKDALMDRTGIACCSSVQYMQKHLLPAAAWQAAEAVLSSDWLLVLRPLMDKSTAEPLLDHCWAIPLLDHYCIDSS